MRMLHVFGAGPDALTVERAARVARGLPGSISHYVDDAAVAARFEGAKPVKRLLPLTGKPSLARYTAIARAIPDCDLVLTYGAAALDALVAKRIFGGKLPPFVHHGDDTMPVGYARLARWLALPAAAAVIASGQIEDGVDLAAFTPGKPVTSLAGIDRQRGDFVIGAVSPLRSGLGLAALVRAAAAIPNAKLVVIGGGPDASALATEARRAGLGNRLVLPGGVRDWPRTFRQFDLLAVPSGGIGRFTLLEAMATGLPIVAPEGIPMPGENVSYANVEGLRDALLRLAGNREMRARIGQANREAAVAHHDALRMIAGHCAIYAAAAGIDIG